MKKLILTLAITLLVFGVSIAQDYNDTDIASHDVEISIPMVALVDVEGTGGEASSITLGATFTGEAGEGLDFSAINDQLWLNYTSIVATTGATRRITVEIDDPTLLPSGVSLNVSAATSATGNGILGTGASVTGLSATAADIVTGIQSGYTEDGTSKGCQLTYSMDMDLADYGTLTQSNPKVKVTYTILDN